MLERMNVNLNFQGEALELRSRRQQVLASNIANADTPGFKGRDFDFAKALRGATQSLPTATAGGALALALPAAGRSMATVSGAAGTPEHARHLPLTIRSGSLGAGRAGSLQWSTPTQASIDNNTVDMDRERANFADNALRYEATVRFINGGVRNTLSAIRGD